MKNRLALILLASTLTMCGAPEQLKDALVAVTESSETGLQTVAEFETRPGNVAVSPDGRVFATMHPLDPSNFQLVEVIDGKAEPFPSLEYQKNGNPASDDKIDTPLGIRVDKNGVLWTIDMGQNLGKTRLFAFNIETREEVYRLEFPTDVAPEGSFIQDLAVDEINGWVYLADIANPGILAVNTNENTVRRFFDPRLKAEDIDMVIDGKVIHFGGAPARVAVNPITISSQRNFIFFGAMNGTKWYYLALNTFREEHPDKSIAGSIGVIGAKPISDGAASSEYGHSYFTNLQEGGIDILTLHGELKPLLRDKSISWPDNVALSQDGWIYMVINQLHTAPAFTGGEDEGKKPYYIKRYKLPKEYRTYH